MTSVFLRAIKWDHGEEHDTIRTTPKDKKHPVQAAQKHAPTTQEPTAAYKCFKQCQNLYHGTSTDRFSQPNIGDTIKVQQELYTTHDKNLARGYADQYQPSAFRPESWIHHIDGFTSPELASSKPLLLRLGTKSPADCDKYVRGNIHMFQHGVELKVLEVESD